MVKILDESSAERDIYRRSTEATYDNNRPGAKAISLIVCHVTSYTVSFVRPRPPI